MAAPAKTPKNTSKKSASKSQKASSAPTKSSPAPRASFTKPLPFADLTPLFPRVTHNPAGLKIPRLFTTKTTDPFDQFTWAKRTSRIGTSAGSSVFSAADVEVPDFWDQVSVDILASKYFRKTGVPLYDDAHNPILAEDGSFLTGPERSLRQTVARLAGAWTIWGIRGNYFFDAASARAFYDEMRYMLCAQMAAPNSPTWFNAGIFEAYAIIQDPDGSWYYDEDSSKLRQSAHRYERTGLNACFISEVKDQLVGDGSIFDFAEREARLFSQGSGSGANLSNLRAAGEPLSAGGSTSGVLSFMKVLDAAAGAIKSGGATRRAAKMVILDVDHPEVEDFIWSKAKEEQKAAALIAAGYDSGYEGEAITSVAFQNANHSVRLTPGFMDAYHRDEPWALLNRTDGSLNRLVSARHLFDQITQAAYECADPGLQFDDIINDWNTVADTERLHGTNPCAEFTHVNDTACNLASLNLVKFYDDESATFDADSFNHAVRLWTLALEIQVSMSHYPAAVIAEKSFAHRPLGLGYANLGALLMRSGLAYDSPESRSVMGAITATLTHGAYATSAELAVAVGPARVWEPNRESFARVIRNHRRAALGTLVNEPYESLTITPVGVDHDILSTTPFANLTETILDLVERSLAGASTGYRNAQVSVLAPTGTIALVMGCDTTGIEPDFALVKMKKLAGGGYMRIINSSITPALIRLGYTPAQIEAILTYALGTKTLSGPTRVNRDSLVLAGLTLDEIDQVARATESVSDLTEAFAPHNLPTLYERISAADSYEMLSRLGFSPEDVLTSSHEICGHLTVEGAPELRPEHLGVFDCAVECGDGTRTIPWAGHIGALSAVAPHLSGSASKTVNLPNSATVTDIKNAYLSAYSSGVKCVAVYRDGSKITQPLNSAKTSDQVASSPESQDPLNSNNPLSALLEELTPGMSPTQFYHGTPVPRFRPPNPRFGPTWRFVVGGEELYLRVNTYSDGSPAEVFLDWGSQGSTLRGMTSALSIALSHALQRGMPIEDLVRAFRGQTFEPNGIVVGHDNLKMATSVVDAVARILGHYFLGRDDLVQIPGGLTATQVGYGPLNHDSVEVSIDAAVAAPATSVLPATDQEIDKAHAILAAGLGQRLYDRTCSTCGSHHMIKAGSCYVCGECGNTTGCS